MVDIIYGICGININYIRYIIPTNISNVIPTSIY